MNEKDQIQDRLRNDLVLYSRTGKGAQLEACLDKIEGGLDFRWGDYPPLGHAANMGKEVTVDILLRRGACPATPGFFGMTPLILAARRGALPCVRRLLEAGADPNTRDMDGRNALDHAREMSHQEVISFLQGTCKDPWQGVDLAVLERFDTDTKQAIQRLLTTLISGGEHGEVDAGPDCYPAPEWYSRLRRSLPIAGLRFRCRPPHISYSEEGRFLTAAEIGQALDDAPYLKESFASFDFAPIAEGSDGNFWGVKLSGDISSSVLLFNQSDMLAHVAYPNLRQFLDDILQAATKPA
ncbi:MAG TPA: ankyrin repeat domain-containing protein [Candidatus Methylacidiphilales bacterium]|nr:ankyrin repeat domain-containing protein [Candidatus Methylacidiphilales bacterium]